jgi:uncharacterized coiled-coil protein SlyX
MAASIIAETPDTATATRHLRTLTEALRKIQEECEYIDHDAQEAVYDIEDAIRNGLTIERSHLEKAATVIESFDDVVSKLRTASDKGWVSLQLLLGKLWRAPNGDLADPNEAGAVSEAIV